MKCPHCNTAFHDSWNGVPVPAETRGASYRLLAQVCPECDQLIAEFQVIAAGQIPTRLRAWPMGTARPLPPEVETRFAADFAEAVAVLEHSPKASAALSRRCLQDLLREKAGARPSSLDAEIQEVLTAGSLPSQLSDDLDAVRVVGNFAAHPIKSTSTGEVVPVEEGEAEWLLDVLEGLFDFYFVLPERAAARRAVLNEKLAEAGKPPLKSGSADT